MSQQEVDTDGGVSWLKDKRISNSTRRTYKCKVSMMITVTYASCHSHLHSIPLLPIFHTIPTYVPYIMDTLHLHVLLVELDMCLSLSQEAPPSVSTSCWLIFGRFMRLWSPLFFWIFFSSRMSSQNPKSYISRWISKTNSSSSRRGISY